MFCPACFLDAAQNIGHNGAWLQSTTRGVSAEQWSIDAGLLAQAIDAPAQLFGPDSAGLDTQVRSVREEQLSNMFLFLISLSLFISVAYSVRFGRPRVALPCIT